MSLRTRAKNLKLETIQEVKGIAPSLSTMSTSLVKAHSWQPHSHDHATVNILMRHLLPFMGKKSPSRGAKVKPMARQPQKEVKIACQLHTSKNKDTSYLTRMPLVKMATSRSCPDGFLGGRAGALSCGCCRTARVKGASTAGGT